MTVWARAAAVHDLPVTDRLDDLATALAANEPAVLVAPPGAGKTTAAPLRLIDEPWLIGRRIVMLEPRRLAARAAAQRMAAVLGEPAGETIGYQTRDERRIGPTTRIEVVTEGVLTRRLQRDQGLGGYGLVVFDEVHERNLPTDLGLAFTLDVRATLRPDLRVLLMSATPAIEPLRGAVGALAIVESAGRTHPVDIVWAPLRKGERVEPATASLVERALREQPGDVLAFLPGIGEIRRVQGLLRVGEDVDVHPLAGALSLAEHDAALAPSPPGRRRVVLSTDIAESSLTVPGIRVVVDAGLARVPRFDPRTGMTRLTTVPASRSSADQRSGRAGRTEPGVAYRLWSKLEQGTRRAHLPAEITQVDLAGLALELAAWGTPVDGLRFADPPPARTLQQAIELLRELEAIDGDGRLTALGGRMLDLPVHPRLARMIAAADRYDAMTACAVAALVDERDIFRGPPDMLPSDLALRCAVLAGLAGDDRAERRDVRRATERMLDLARRAGVRGGDVRPERCGAVLALGFPDRLAVRRERSQPGQFQLRTGSAAFVSPADPLAVERFIIAADLDGRRDRARARLAAAVDADDLIIAFAHEIERRTELVWDGGALVERTEARLGAMVLETRTTPAAPGSVTSAALLERVRATRLGALDWTPAAERLRQRVAFLRGTFGDEWPDWGDRALLARLDAWLAPHLAGRTGLAGLDPGAALQAELSWDRRRELDELAPARFTTPSGRQVAIDYGRAAPTASVRVQDVFGLTVHPSVAGGRVPLVLELLSPADRPLQITADLPGFWAGSWAEVRKEMAGRYPKHHWPLDPATAPPPRSGRGQSH